MSKNQDISNNSSIVIFRESFSKLVNEASRNGVPVMAMVATFEEAKFVLLKELSEHQETQKPEESGNEE